MDSTVEGKWFEHAPESVLENNKTKILWDFAIQTDWKLSHNRPYIILIDKETNKCPLVNVACHVDSQICLKEHKKEERYIDLAFEIKRLWRLCKVRINPIVIGTLGTFSTNLQKYLENLCVGVSIQTLQKSVPMGPVGILRRNQER
ncbi:uncharacterized protein [Montipora capricornis]|uniref:uncharacterized protein n=1 Tax=Montipora capricornis TaxID=246305 RepID=UPI0035F1BFBE